MFKKVILTFIFLLSPFLLFSSYLHDVEVNAVPSAGVIVVSIRNIPEVFGKMISVKIEGIESPSSNGDCEKERILAMKARDRLEGLLFRAKTVSLDGSRRGMYFSLIAKVRADNADVSGTLLAEGLARVSSGYQRTNWCL